MEHPLSPADWTRPIYGIGAVARLVDLPAATLRTWENRYGVIKPHRSPGGRRLYSHEQLEATRSIAAQIRAGMRPAEAHLLVSAPSEHQADQRALAPGDRKPPPTPNPVGMPSSARILLVDRDRAAADLAAYFLSTLGLRVEEVSTASDAIRSAERLRPALVIVEIMIDGGRGLRLVRELHERMGVPIVAMATIEAGEASAAAGARGFLSKPLDPPKLFAMVGGLIGFQSGVSS